MGSPQNSGGVNATFDEHDGGDFSKPFKLVTKMLRQWFFTRTVRCCNWLGWLAACWLIPAYCLHAVVLCHSLHTLAAAGTILPRNCCWVPA